MEVRPANLENAHRELQTCELLYSVHRLPEQNGLLHNCEGEKKKNRKEEKNVLVLSAVGLSRGSFFFFLFWMKSGILMGTPSQPRQPLKAPLVRGTRDRRIHCFANLKLSLFPLSFLLDLLVFTLSEYFNPYCGDWCNLSH